MQSISEIKHHIKTIQETGQLTRAMNLISITKMRKAQILYEKNHQYEERVRFILKDILIHATDIQHPFLQHKERDRVAYVVIAGDKGMCGSYNNNVLHHAEKDMADKKQKFILTIGQMARTYFQARDYEIDIDFLHTAQNPSLYNARRIANDIIGLYNGGQMDEVRVVFTRFYSPTRQQPRVLKLLPLELSDFDDVETNIGYQGRPIYMPSPRMVFDTMVNHYVVGMIYSALVQSAASEHSARMLAMETATSNAQKITQRLRLAYNRARQEKITNEIIEIASGAEALKELHQY
jgi:F-type H+-transporting ATPase subunit gamma